MGKISEPRFESMLWTARQVAVALGLSERTIWTLTKKGLLQCVRIPGVRIVRYAPEAVKDFVEQNRGG
ncbi:MAG: helix-turn-helix domain-containing protein [Planctomycetaceae bacterium]|nr:helix-turn-helix domain-containing protein [Planctomycetaceae bacterium]